MMTASAEASSTKSFRKAAKRSATNRPPKAVPGPPGATQTRTEAHQLAEDHPAIQPQHIGGAEDDAGGDEGRDPAIDLEGADHDQELADEAAGAGPGDRGQGEP